MAKTTKEQTYDIFISYRRDNGFDTAKLIAATLRHAGYRVFLDVEQLRAGKFNEQLYAVIERCKDVIVVLPKDGLDRCVNETDWVRREIIHAMAHGKNIIPVMLAGFKWPEAMPAGLEGFNLNQAIAAGDHDYFDAAMDKLKSYLKAKRCIKPFRMFMWPSGVVACLLAIGFGIRWLAIPVCVEVTDKIAGGMTVIDNLTAISLDVGKEWNAYYEKYRKATLVETTSLNEGMEQYLKFKRNEVQKLRQYTPSRFEIGELRRWMLYVRGINVADIDAFHPICLSFFDDVEERLNVLEAYLRMEPVPEISVANNEISMSFSQHTANVAYYGYLHLLSSMPHRAWNTYKKVSIMWNHFPSHISLYLPKEEYERLGKIELDNKMNAKIGMLGNLTSEQLLKLESDERNVKELRAKVENGQANNEAMEAQLKTLLDKAKEVGASEEKLRNLEKQRDDVYQRLLEKCTLSSEDGQGMMWGKILRLAKGMDSASPSRKEDLLQELNQRLDFYAAHIADAKGYIPSVKQFYALVVTGDYPLGGMAVVLTQDNQLHPVLKVGDIVLSRKGRPANSTADYTNAKEASGDDVLVFLRSNANGALILRKETLPPTDVLTGFLVLREED